MNALHIYGYTYILLDTHTLPLLRYRKARASLLPRSINAFLGIHKRWSFPCVPGSLAP